jgi:hypothetical protein
VDLDIRWRHPRDDSKPKIVILQALFRRAYSTSIAPCTERFQPQGGSSQRLTRMVMRALKQADPDVSWKGKLI